MDITPKTRAIESLQWGIPTYSFVMTYDQIDHLMPTRDPATYPYINENNRPISLKHIKNCANFILDVDDSPLGNISIAAPKDSVGYDEGDFVLTINNKNLIVIIDGQHRRLGIKEALQRAVDEKGYEFYQNIQNRKVLVTLYATRDEKKIRQLFGWFNKSRPIDKNIMARFDLSDTFKIAANDCMEESDMLRRCVVDIEGGLKVKTPALLSFADHDDIMKLVNFHPREGFRSRQIKNDYNSDEARGELISKTIKFWHEFMIVAVPDIKEIYDGNCSLEDIAVMRKNSYGLEPDFIKCLAVIYHAWGAGNIKNLASFLSTINTKKDSINDDHPLVKWQLIDVNTGRITAKTRKEIVDAASMISQEIFKNTSNAL